MGIWRYYVCDKCGWKQCFSVVQPGYGRDRLIWQTYCPKTDQIIHVYDKWDDEAAEILCIEMKRGRSRKMRGRVGGCHRKNCDGRCLKDLVILAYDEKEEAVSYKCPRSDCDGIMQVDPEIWIIGD